MSMHKLLCRAPYTLPCSANLCGILDMQEWAPVHHFEKEESTSFSLPAYVRI